MCRSKQTSPVRGKLRNRMSRPTGVIIAPPNPCTMRIVISIGRLFASPHSADPLGREPGRDAAQRAAARHPALRPAGSVGGIIEQPARAIARDELLDQVAGHAHRFVIAPETPLYPALQHLTQIFGRAGVAFEMAECPRFDQRVIDRRRRGFCRPLTGKPGPLSG